MAILVTGGTGKTGVPLTRLLHDAGHSVYVTSRSPEKVASPYKAVRFEWTDESTRENPFKAAADANEHIDAIYLVGPSVPDLAAVVNPFIDVAVKHGVKRFVQLGASPVKKGSPPMGIVQDYLESLGVSYCTLRPTWFQENFLYHQFLQPILNDDQIVTATGDGRIPFISADDIAEAAYKALTAATIEESDLLVLGPELLTYDQVAASFTEVLGRPIIHKHVSVKESIEHRVSLQIPEPAAQMLAGMEAMAAAGSEEEHFTSTNPKYIGRHKLKDFIIANKATWIK